MVEPFAALVTGTQLDSGAGPGLATTEVFASQDLPGKPEESEVDVRESIIM